MSKLQGTLGKVIERTLPWVVLAVLVAYSYAKFFGHWYGISWTRDGIVSEVFVNEREPTIHAGDRLLQVGPVPFSAFSRDLRQVLFSGARPGDVVPVILERNGQTVNVDWRVPGANPGETREELLGVWVLAYVFWAAGTLTMLSLRPRGIHWVLLAAFNFVTSIWLMAGSGLSSYHLWYSALVVRVALWISVPIYLHLHWVFPRSLGRFPPVLTWAVYVASGAFAAAQWFQVIPPNLYAAAFFTAVGGSVVLLIIHTLRQPDMRRELSFLLIAALFAAVPSLVAAVVGTVQGGTVPRVGPVTLLTFPILPAAYLYAAYRRQLGGLEMRVNRLISIYIFLIVLGMIVVPVLVLMHRLPIYSPEQPLVISIFSSLLVAGLALGGFPVFQSFVERRILGIAVPSNVLQQTYSAHITSSNSFAELTRVLDKDIMPSLLVRQFVFLIVDNGRMRPLLSAGVTEDQIPGRGTLSLLVPASGKTSPSGLQDDRRYAWVRLALPLRVQDNLIGIWLFGRRDPDDMYSTAEIPILQLFANQTAVALSNILQSERLRSMYQADIDRHETERLSLARDLHDSVLSELAGMLMNTDVRTLPKGFQEGYQTLTGRLREIVSELRPPMLSYGLKAAIEELADKLMERSHDAVDIVVELESEGQRYPEDKEQHLFRIVQEACENVVRHSEAKNARVAGRLAADCAEISVEDDGRGFKLGKESIQLYDLLSQRHFGLAGMLERAELIHAEIHISSSEGKGTRVDINWKADAPRPGGNQGLVEPSS